MIRLASRIINNVQVIGMPLVISVLYVWCQVNRDTVVQFWFGTQFKAMYLPWALAAFNVLLGGKLVQCSLFDLFLSFSNETIMDEYKIINVIRLFNVYLLTDIYPFPQIYAIYQRSTPSTRGICPCPIEPDRARRISQESSSLY